MKGKVNYIEIKIYCLSISNILRFSFMTFSFMGLTSYTLILHCDCIKDLLLEGFVKSSIDSRLK
jgi:hypothetical protein